MEPSLSTQHQLRTLLLNATALFIIQFAFLSVMHSALLWALIWLYPVGPILIACSALLLTKKTAPLKKTTALCVLPIVLYISGNLASLCMWWTNGAAPAHFPLQFDAFLGFTPLFSVFGAPALLMWAGYLLQLRSLRRTTPQERIDT